MKTFVNDKRSFSTSNTIAKTKGGISMPSVAVQMIAQKKEDNGEEPVQGRFTTQFKGPEEEEPLQGKFTTQFKGPEEEEPLQGKFTTQFKGPEEEGPLQGKFTTQFKGPEEEEPLQGKFATQFKGPEEEEPLQGKWPVQLKGDEKEHLQMKPFQFTAGVQEKLPVQRKSNNTGLPDNLKAGVENLSGFNMDDVKVHYNSAKPAQLQALAYAQGTNIHIGPGQERHLPHEAWHVAQQKQGRVQPTVQMKEGVAVNDDKGLEDEADKMGAKALQRITATPNSGRGFSAPVQRMAVVTQLVTALVDDRLNVVGEDHPETAGRLKREKKYAKVHSGSSNYWSENEFRVRAYSFWTDSINDKRAFADPFELRFNQAQVFLQDNAVIIRNDGNANRTNQVAWDNLNSQRKFIHNLWTYLQNLSSSLLTFQTDGFELTAARRTQMLGYAQQIKDIAVTWQAARVVLANARGIADPGEGFDWASGGVAVTGHANPRADFKASVDALSAINVVNRTADELSEDRSAAMHVTANNRHNEAGVWKVGEAHRADMDNEPVKNYNLVSLVDFNADYNTWTP